MWEKRYLVTIEFMNNRKNTLVVWATDEESAIKLALKWWGFPTIYKSITAEER